MFMPIYNGKSTSMIYIPQSHTHEHNYGTGTKQELCDTQFCNAIGYTFFGLLGLGLLIAFILAFICLSKY